MTVESTAGKDFFSGSFRGGLRKVFFCPAQDRGGQAALSALTGRWACVTG